MPRKIASSSSSAASRISSGLVGFEALGGAGYLPAVSHSYLSTVSYFVRCAKAVTCSPGRHSHSRLLNNTVFLQIKADSIDGGVTSSMRLLLGKLEKKDPQTKTKALGEFVSEVTTADDAEVDNTLVHWRRIYPRLCLDIDRRVRLAAQAAMQALAVTAKKKLAAHLNVLAGPWLVAQYDPARDVAAAAERAFSAAFPAEAKQTKAIVFCFDGIVEHIKDMLLIQTAASLADIAKAATDNTHDKEARRERVLSSGLAALARVVRLDHGGPGALCESLAAILTSPQVWKFTKHSAPNVRAATFDLAAVTLKHVSLEIIFSQLKKMAQLLFAGLSDSDGYVLRSCWNAVLHLVLHVPQFWEVVSPRKSVWPHVFGVLRDGGRGQPETTYASLVPLLGKVPTAVIGENAEFYSSLYDALGSGVSVIRADSSSRTAGIRTAAAVMASLHLDSTDPDVLSYSASRTIDIIFSTARHGCADAGPALSLFCATAFKAESAALRPEASVAAWTALQQACISILMEKKPTECEPLVEEKGSLTRRPLATKPEQRALSAVELVEKVLELVSPLTLPGSSAAIALASAICSISPGTGVEGTAALVGQTLATFCRSGIFGMVPIGGASNNVPGVDVPEKAFAQLHDQLSLIKSSTSEFRGAVLGCLAAVAAEPESATQEVMQSHIISTCILGGPVTLSAFIEASSSILVCKYLPDWRKSCGVDEIIKATEEAALAIIDPASPSQASDRASLVGIMLRQEDVSVEITVRLMKKLLDASATANLTGLRAGSDNNSADALAATIVTAVELALKPNTTESIVSEVPNLLFQLFLLGSRTGTIISQTARSGWQNVMQAAVISAGSHVNDMFTRAVNLMVDHAGRSAVDHSIVALSDPLCTERVAAASADACDLLNTGALCPVDALHTLLPKAEFWRKMRQRLGPSFASGIEMVIDRSLSMSLIAFSHDDSHDVHKSDEHVWTAHVAYAASIGCAGIRINEEAETSAMLSQELRWAVEALSDPQWPLEQRSKIIFDETLRTEAACKSMKAVKDLQSYSGVAAKAVDLAAFIAVSGSGSNLLALVVLQDAIEGGGVPAIEQAVMLVEAACTSLDLGIASAATTELLVSCLSCDQFPSISAAHRLRELSIDRAKDSIERKTHDRTAAIALAVAGAILESRSTLRDLNSGVEEEVMPNHSSEPSKRQDASGADDESSGCEQKAAASAEIRRIRASSHEAALAVLELFVELHNADDQIFTTDSELRESATLQIWTNAVILSSSAVVLFEHCISHLPGLLTEEHWDLILCTALGWLNTPPGGWTEAILVSRTVALFATVDRVLNCTADSDAMGAMVEEWKEFFRPSTGEQLVTAFSHVTSAPAPKPSRNWDMVRAIIVSGVAKFSSDSALAGHIKLANLTTLLSTENSSLRIAAYDLACRMIDITRDPTLNNDVDDELATLLSSVELSLSYQDAQVSATAGLLGGLLICRQLRGAISSAQVALIAQLRASGVLNLLLNTILPVVEGADAADVAVLTNHFFEPGKAGETGTCFTELAYHTFAALLRAVPSIVRDWFQSLGRQQSINVSKFAAEYISPGLISSEIENVKHAGSLLNDDTMQVRARPAAGEIIATYSTEGMTMELVVIFDKAHPLLPTKVTCGQRIGVPASQWRGWLLQMVMLSNRSNNIIDAVKAWKANVDKKFEGLEDCAICYSSIHGSNFSVPDKICRTCKHAFHGACLFKWFSTSQQSTCPLCRNVWIA